MAALVDHLLINCQKIPFLQSPFTEFSQLRNRNIDLNCCQGVMSQTTPG